MAQSVVSFLKGLLIQKEDDRSKQLQIEVDSSATTNTKTTLQAKQTANRTLSLPDETGELVGPTAPATLTNKTIDADNNTISNIDNNEIKALAGIDASKLADGSVSNTEYQYINSLTSNAQDQLDQNAQDIADHIADATDAHDASAISSVPSGNLAATDVQAALNELQSDVDTRALNSDLQNHINDISDAHDASAISNVPSGNLSATDVQGALDELQSDVDTRATTASNVGVGTGNVFKQKTGSTLELKTLIAGTNITITDNASDITIAASGGGGGANTSLSNLTNPTSINQDLKPDSANTRSIGAGTQWIRVDSFRFQSTNLAGTNILNIGADTTGEGGTGGGVLWFNTSGTDPLYIESRDNSTVDAVQTSDVVVQSGDKTAGTGNSGKVQLKTGTSSGGTRGSIDFIDGSEGTSGAAWISKGTGGQGNWVNPTYQISSSSGNYTTSSTSYGDVTNLSVTITTHGRPVMLMLIGDGTQYSSIGTTESDTSTESYFAFLRDASILAENAISSVAFDNASSHNTQINVPPGALSHFDVPASGTYTYKVQAKASIGSTASVSNCKLVAYEL